MQRLARGGEVLAPAPVDAPAQVIDARDMASWIVGLLARGESGAYHAVSPPPPFSFGDQLEAIRSAVAPEGTTLTWVDADFLVAEGLDDGTLPLWSGADPSALIMAADPGAALATGLQPRALGETIRDTLAWLREQKQPDQPGLDPHREADLLARWHAR